MDPQVPYLNTSNRQLTLNGRTPQTVKIDTGAKPVLIGSSFATLLGLTQASLAPAPYQIVSATETIETVLGISTDPIEFIFYTGFAADTTSVLATVLVSKAQDYDVLLGQDVLFQIGAVVDHSQGQFMYHPEYSTDGVRLSSIPLLRPKLGRPSGSRCVPYAPSPCPHRHFRHHLPTTAIEMKKRTTTRMPSTISLQ